MLVLRGGFKYGFRLEVEVENRVHSKISLVYVLGLNYLLVSWFGIRSAVRYLYQI